MATTATLPPHNHDINHHNHHNHHISVTIGSHHNAPTTSPLLHSDINITGNNIIDPRNNNDERMDEMMMTTRTPRATPVGDTDMDDPLLYRCPVSTPANFVHPSGRTRRTKAASVSLEIPLNPGEASQSRRAAGGKPPRPGGAARAGERGGGGGTGGGGGGMLASGRSNYNNNPAPSRTGGSFGNAAYYSNNYNHMNNINNYNSNSNSFGGSAAVGGNSATSGLQRTLTGLGPSGLMSRGPPVGTPRTLDYYYVDKKEDARESRETNTFWLRALCAQPVTEILDKYRRRSELKRTRSMWNRTSTTPGERSLLRAWEKNASHVFGIPPRDGMLLASSSSVVRFPGVGAKGGGGGGGGGGSRRSVPGSQRRYHSEPVNRSRSYVSNDTLADDITNVEGGTTEGGEGESGGEGAKGSGRVSVATGVSFKTGGSTSSGSPSPTQYYSPEQRTNLQYPANSKQQVAVQPGYDISDNYQVTLPAVNRNPNRLGTPKSKNRTSTQNPRGILRDKPEAPVDLALDLSEGRESVGDETPIRGVRDTQTDSKTFMTHLPSIV